MLHKQLGINPYPEGVKNCPMTHSDGSRCGKPLSEFHAEVCPCLHSERTRRHTRLNLQHEDLARHCGGHIGLGEPKLSLFFRARDEFKNTSSSLAGDRDFGLGPNGRYVVDYSVAAAVQQDLVEAAGTEPPGVAARNREAVKVKRLESYFHVEDMLVLVKFVAFVWETTGGIGPAAQELFGVMRDNYMAGYDMGGGNIDYGGAADKDKLAQTKAERARRFQWSIEGMAATIHQSVGLSTWLIQERCKAELAKQAVINHTEARIGIGIRPQIAC